MRHHVLVLFAIVTCLALVAPLAAQDGSFKLTIMHSNDVYAVHEPECNGDGGAGRLATVIRQIRTEVATTGNRFSGTLFHIA
ncbi:MAG: hypothetical protein J4G17_13315 [Anaerolineae bacterium]|nr:hypothetical protein [Anaerolineae bacterium]